MRNCHVSDVAVYREMHSTQQRRYEETLEVFAEDTRGLSKSAWIG
jgi:hypothetical protein